MRQLIGLVAGGLLSLAIGCAQSNNSASAPAEGNAAAEGQQFVLAEEPADAKPVAEVRKAAKDGDEVAITGLIGGDVDPWIKGRAAFVIVDPSLKPCSAIHGDNCPTPWDFCCEPNLTPEHKATIKFVDDAGQTVPTDARELFGIKELAHVTVRGQAKRDEAGNLTVLASGIFIKR